VGKWTSEQVGKWASGQVGKWASGQVGKWASGQVGKWASRKGSQNIRFPFYTCSLAHLSTSLFYTHLTNTIFATFCLSPACNLTRYIPAGRSLPLNVTA